MINETLIHYSNKPLREVQSVPLTAQKLHFKPVGLWVSVKGPDDWKSWCQSEEYGLSRLSNPHRIELAETANILRLSSAAHIDGFTKRYGHSRYSNTIFAEVAWSKVASSYDGIIIAPYIWKRRLDCGANWYYSWDCASGCIWNATAVEKIVPLSSEQGEDASAEEEEACRE